VNSSSTVAAVLRVFHQGAPSTGWPYTAIKQTLVTNKKANQLRFSAPFGSALHMQHVTASNTYKGLQTPD
jgi:hypothetical protein